MPDIGGGEWLPAAGGGDGDGGGGGDCSGCVVHVIRLLTTASVVSATKLPSYVRSRRKQYCGDVCQYITARHSLPSSKQYVLQASRELSETLPRFPPGERPDIAGLQHALPLAMAEDHWRITNTKLQLWNLISCGLLQLKTELQSPPLTWAVE